MLFRSNDRNTANLKLTELVEGEYLFRFYATDNSGATSSDEVTLYVVEPANTDLQANSTSVVLYPNTFRNHINLEIQAAEPEEYRVVVFDMLGKAYYRSSFMADSFTTATHTINFSEQEIKEGIYLIRIENKEGSFRKTLKVVSRK